MHGTLGGGGVLIEIPCSLSGFPFTFSDLLLAGHNYLESLMTD